jgi:hypothetical protein
MDDKSKESLNAWGRSAVIVYAIMRGEELTTSEVAHRVGVVYTTALRMMGELSRVLPIVQDGDGAWAIME